MQQQQSAIKQDVADIKRLLIALQSRELSKTSRTAAPGKSDESEESDEKR